MQKQFPIKDNAKTTILSKCLIIVVHLHNTGPDVF